MLHEPKNELFSTFTNFTNFAPIVDCWRQNSNTLKNYIFLIYFAYCVGTVFENPQNVAFEVLQFPTIFALTKVACLVTLFNRKLQFFKNSSNVPFLMNFCPLK